MSRARVPTPLGTETLVQCPSDDPSPNAQHKPCLDSSGKDPTSQMSSLAQLLQVPASSSAFHLRFEALQLPKHHVCSLSLHTQHADHLLCWLLLSREPDMGSSDKAEVSQHGNACISPPPRWLRVSSSPNCPPRLPTFLGFHGRSSSGSSKT